MRKLTEHLDRYQLLYLLIFSIFLTFNLHSKSKINSYHHVLWADGSGYYMYLPATFEYGYSVKNMPDSLEMKTGGGYTTDMENDLIKIKYTYGVALLELPFYLIGNVINYFSDNNEGGFGKVQHSMIMLSGVFYLILGLYFLKRFLSSIFNSGIASLTILFIFGTTTLFYYGIHKGSYAHIYLFFLFSFSLYRANQVIEKRTIKNYLLLILPLTLSIIIRPTSILVLPLLMFIRCINKADFMQRILLLKTDIKKILIAVGISSVLFIPQMIYWYYVSGSFISYSYGSEGFSNLASPKIAEILFSPKNGLFLYSPVIFFIFIYMIINSGKNKYNLLLLSVFVISVYLFASWETWTFGCSYGSRSFTEYSAFYTVALAAWINSYSNKQNKIPIVTLCSILIYCSYINIKTVYAYDDCYYGDTWDFETFFKVIKLV